MIRAFCLQSHSLWLPISIYNILQNESKYKINCCWNLLNIISRAFDNPNLSRPSDFPASTISPYLFKLQYPKPVCLNLVTSLNALTEVNRYYIQKSKMVILYDSLLFYWFVGGPPCPRISPSGFCSV